MTHGDRLSLQRRVLRLGKPPRRWRKPPWAASAMQEPREVRLVAKPLASVVGTPSLQAAPAMCCPASERCAPHHTALLGSSHAGGLLDSSFAGQRPVQCDGCRSPCRVEEPLHWIRRAGVHRRRAGAAALRQSGGRRLARYVRAAVRVPELGGINKDEFLHVFIEAITDLFRYPVLGTPAETLGTESVCIIVFPFTSPSKPLAVVHKCRRIPLGIRSMKSLKDLDPRMNKFELLICSCHLRYKRCMSCDGCTALQAVRVLMRMELWA